MVDDRALFEAIDKGDLQARETLVNRYSNLARALARRYGHRGEAMEDLQQVAMMGLLQAIDRYSADREAAFSSFAVPTILGEIKRHFRDKTWAIRVPRDLQELSLKLEPSLESLGRELGRTPTDEELSSCLNINSDQLSEARGALEAYRANSLDSSSGDEEGAYAEHIGQRDPHFLRSEQHELIESLLVCLEDREREIVRLRFYHELSQAEIAEKMGISQMHVSRLLRQALKQLAQAADESGTRLEAALQ
jgi:RNA polymerase sigma-B factor